MSNASARPSGDDDPIRPVLHDPEHLAYLLDQIHALERYIAGGAAVAISNSYARGPDGQDIAISFRVTDAAHHDVVAQVRRERVGPAKPRVRPGGRTRDWNRPRRSS